MLSEETLEIHVDDMRSMGLKDGDRVRMSSSKGSVEIRVATSDQSPPGTMFCSFSFNEVPINYLTGAGFDPVTETAEFKVCAVNLVKLEPSPSRST